MLQLFPQWARKLLAESACGGWQGQDLATGNLTAPVVFALAHPHHGAELEGLIQSEFVDEGALARALALVQAAGGMAAARSLARQEADLVRCSLRYLV